MRIATTGLTIFILLAPVALGAQDAEQQATRVRVTETDGSVMTGTLRERSDEGLLVIEETTGLELLVREDRIRSVETSLGEHRSFGKNFFSTVGITAVAGGFIGAVTWTPCRETGFLACFLHPSSRGEALAVGLVGGGFLGIPIGLIVGLAKKSERWEPVSPSALGGVRIDVVPTVDGQLGIRGSIPLGGR